MKEFKAESKKLLDLVVNSIYTNREIFLRELISNASDAIDKRKFMSLTDSALDADFNIELSVDKAARTLTVSDNGVGMSEKELEDNLGVIAASGTEAFKKEIGKSDDAELIGRFGVGFYASFMVADKVTVISKRVGETKAHKWESNGVDGFEITEAERNEIGTSVILHIREDGEESYSQYLEMYTLETLVKKYSDYIRYPVRAERPKAADKDGVTVGEMTTLNSMTPVWKKSKTELGETELNDFYKRTYRDFTDPILTVSSRVEGAVDYTSLLFVPHAPAYDYYTKDYKRGLQLYCNGVLIMDKCAELVPEYLGFVRGVIDTPDLALNISRETLQEDRRVRAIANGIEKKLLGEFEKTLKNDREKYEKLFSAFAKAIKFGAYDNFGANKDKLKDLLLYYSDAKKKLITFKEYVEGLDKGAPILYACGETVDKIAMQPQLEGARASGKDVLYFVDPVDEFIARMLESYDGHKLENVASGAVQGAADISGHEDMIARIQSQLNGKATVAATDKLKSYPVCLAAKGDVSLEMERVMEAMGGGLKAERVLQVNFDHPVIKQLETADDARFADTVTVLYNEALLAEGYRTEPDFIAAINRLIATEDVKPAPKTTAKTTAAKSSTKTTAAKTTATKTTAKKSATATKSGAAKASTSATAKKPAAKSKTAAKNADSGADKGE
ncbi:MAG: molecular chaperone HtpG [Clostridiales bacterium]|nr:molecular chaperone HtpG [Clostridiales bacterium]